MRQICIIITIRMGKRTRTNGANKLSLLRLTLFSHWFLSQLGLDNEAMRTFLLTVFFGCVAIYRLVSLNSLLFCIHFIDQIFLFRNV